MADPQTAFAGYPSAVVFQQPEAVKKDLVPVQHLLWGDWLLLTGASQGTWVEVKARGVKGWMRKSDVQKERLLEVSFIDIGQGDGALVCTPEDKHLILDAGQGDNMFRFLRWRFGKFLKPFNFEAAIISHPDSDHYAGFDAIFEVPTLTFGTIYHNGIIERKAASDSKGLGEVKKEGDKRYLVDVVRNQVELKALLDQPALIKGKKYPTMLKKAVDSGRVMDVRSLSVSDKFLPGYEADKDLQIAVLGPVVEPDAAGTPRLRWFDNVSKTKNGHSVVLRLQYKRVSVLLGGDLNIPSEHLLLAHHTGLVSPPAAADEEKLVKAGRKVFQSDVAKACHHGSADFTDLFLRSVNPIATVISSGDDEPHSHPRAESLGGIGRHSRGDRPLIFSTELARSAPETIKHPFVLRKQIAELRKEIDATTNAEAKQKAQAKLDKLLTGVLDRSVAVYGAINLRTDGDRVVIAQKIERAGGLDKKWDIYPLERDGNGELHYVSKHAE